MRDKKIIIVGRGGSGKDYLCDYLSDKCGLRRGLLHTTRSKRLNEVDGHRHYFIRDDKFLEMVRNNEFQEYTDYIIKDNIRVYYGITHSDYDKCQFTSKTPITIKSVDLSSAFIIYLNIPEYYCLERMNGRLNNIDSPERRIASDRLDFKYFKDEYNVDLEINDPFFDPAAVYEIIKDVVHP